MGWNKQTIDLLNAKLVALGVAPIDPYRGWNRVVLDLLGALSEAGSGIPLPTHITQDWNNEFLFRLVGLLDAVSGGAFRTVSPWDMALIDVVGLIKTTAYNPDTGIWSITTFEAGANETGGKAVVSTDPTTAAAFWLLPIMGDGEQTTNLDMGLDLVNDLGTSSNLLVAIGYAAAPNAAACSLGYDFAAGQANLNVQGNLSAQTRTYTQVQRIRWPANFTQATAVVHFWNRPAAYYFPFDSSVPSTALIPAGSHSSTINPNYLLVSFRPVGLVPNNTNVQIRVKYSRTRRPEDWTYAP